MLDYIDKLVAEQQSWQQLLSHYEQQVETSQRLLASVNVPLTHSSECCPCLSLLSDKHRTLLENKSEYGVCCDILQLLNEHCVMMETMQMACVERLAYHKYTLEQATKENILQLYKESWRDCGVDVGKNCFSWFSVE
jgi:hypothetical protein